MKIDFKDYGAVAAVTITSTIFEFRKLWGGDRFCTRGSLPRKTCEALRDKALGRTSRICTAGRKMRFYYDLCDEFCTITDC